MQVLKLQQNNQAAEAELQTALKGQDAAKREHDILSKKHQTALQNLKVRLPEYICHDSIDTSTQFCLALKAELALFGLHLCFMSILWLLSRALIRSIPQQMHVRYWFMLPFNSSMQWPHGNDFGRGLVVLGHIHRAYPPGSQLKGS